MMNTKSNGSLNHEFSEASPHQGVSSGILFETLWHHPMIILGTSVLALLAAYLHLSRVTPLYTSTARVYVEREIPKVIRDAEGGVMTKLDNYLYTQAEVLRSNPVLAKALRSLETGQMRTFRESRNCMSVLYGSLQTAVGKMDGIINISFKGPQPEEAADTVNAVVDAYVAFHGEQKRKAATALLKILEEARIHRDAKTDHKYEELLKFRRQNEGLAFGSDQANNIILRQMESLLRQLSDARVTTSELKQIYDTALTLAEDVAALRQFLEARRGRSATDTATAKITALEAELIRLRGDKADILLELKPGHPAIATLEGEIKRVHEEIAELDRLFAQRQLAIVRQEYLAAKQREEELVQQCETQRQEVLLLNDQLAQYTRLQSEYERAKEPSDVLDDRIDELSVTEAVGGLTVTILERAWPASVPSEPKKARGMAIALLLGLCAGVGLGLCREICDQRLRSSEEISTLLKLPVLGAIPTIRSPLHSRLLHVQMVRICPTSPEAEAFRRLRTPLLFGTLNGKARTVLVTSPSPGDGKTTVVSNLGLVLAQAGQKVLIVDADRHTPKQHRIFKKDRQQKGLSLVLGNQMNLEDAIEPTGMDNLDLLTCGPDVVGSCEMLNSERFRGVLTMLSDRYDRVLIDSPSVLSFTDAQILAAQCDSVVLVLRAETSTRKDSVQAYAELAEVSARVLGVVVNAAPRKRGRSPYSRHYCCPDWTKALTGDNGQGEGTKALPLERLFKGESQW